MVYSNVWHIVCAYVCMVYSNVWHIVCAYTVKNGVFQNSCLGCLYVHSSTTPNRVFLKPPLEGVTGHPQNTIISDSESLKGVLCKYLHSINS